MTDKEEDLEYAFTLYLLDLGANLIHSMGTLNCYMKGTGAEGHIYETKENMKRAAISCLRELQLRAASETPQELTDKINNLLDSIAG